MRIFKSRHLSLRRKNEKGIGSPKHGLRVFRVILRMRVRDLRYFHVVCAASRAKSWRRHCHQYVVVLLLLLLLNECYYVKCDEMRYDVFLTRKSKRQMRINIRQSSS